MIQKDFQDILGAKTVAGLGDALEYYKNSEGVFLKDLPTYQGSESKQWKMYCDYYGGDKTYFDKWVQSALSQKRFGSSTFRQDFNKYPLDNPAVGLGEVAKKGTAYLSGYLEIFQFFEKAKYDLKNNCDGTFPCMEACKAWNNAGAFFIGSAEGKNGLNGKKINENDAKGSYGYQIYTLGAKRCANYGTCGPAGDQQDKGIPAKNNIVIIELLQKGAAAVALGDLETIEKTIDEINSQILVGFIQGAIRYAYKLPALEIPKGGKELGEAVTFAAAAIPQIANVVSTKPWLRNKGKKASVLLQKAYQVKRNFDPSEFPATQVKDVFECFYEELGISCSDIGTLYDGGTDGKYIPCKDEKNVCSIPSTAKQNKCKNLLKRKKLK